MGLFSLFSPNEAHVLERVSEVKRSLLNMYAHFSVKFTENLTFFPNICEPYQQVFLFKKKKFFKKLYFWV